MPILLDAVEHELTLGEICGALRNAWGEYRAEG
jgi:methylmalonyl-CoA mutase N-terminal domain/subunit